MTLRVAGRPMLPAEDSPEWRAALEHWRSLASDAGAHYDTVVRIEAADIAPTVTWGTSPQVRAWPEPGSRRRVARARTRTPIGPLASCAGCCAHHGPRAIARRLR